MSTILSIPTAKLLSSYAVLTCISTKTLTPEEAKNNILGKTPEEQESFLEAAKLLSNDDNTKYKAGNTIATEPSTNTPQVDNHKPKSHTEKLERSRKEISDPSKGDGRMDVSISSEEMAKSAFGRKPGGNSR